MISQNKDKIMGWVRYLLSMLMVVAFTLLNITIQRISPGEYLRVPYVLLVGLVAYLFGVGPAVLALFLSVISFGYVYGTPKYRFWPLITTHEDYIQLSIVVLSSTFAAAAMVALRNSKARVIERTQQLEKEINERIQAEQRETEAELHRQEFYRRTIFAATEGKLLICDPEDIVEKAGPPTAEWDVKSLPDIAVMRNGVLATSEAFGMEELRLCEFASCAVEAAANAVKHANGGKATLHTVGNSLMFIMSDSGPGIEALALPDVALTKGYSTTATLGMGYKLMIEFCDKVYLSTGPEGTVVACEMKI